MKKLFGIVIETGISGLQAANTLVDIGKNVLDGFLGEGDSEYAYETQYDEDGFEDAEQFYYGSTKAMKELLRDRDPTLSQTRAATSGEDKAQEKVKAPGIKLEAIGSRQEIILNDIGKPAVLLCHGQKTANWAKEINVAIRAKLKQVTSVLVANVIDLHDLPKALRKTAVNRLTGVYRQVAAEFADPVLAKNLLYILPDWEGNVAQAFQLRNLNREISVVVLNGEGGIVGISQGGDPLHAAFDMLSEVSI